MSFIEYWKWAGQVLTEDADPEDRQKCEELIKNVGDDIRFNLEKGPLEKKQG